MQAMRRHKVHLPKTGKSCDESAVLSLLNWTQMDAQYFANCEGLSLREMHRQGSVLDLAHQWRLYVHLLNFLSRD